jgi:hypothetical protein
MDLELCLLPTLDFFYNSLKSFFSNAFNYLCIEAIFPAACSLQQVTLSKFLSFAEIKG